VATSPVELWVNGAAIFVDGSETGDTFALVSG